MTGLGHGADGSTALERAGVFYDVLGSAGPTMGAPGMAYFRDLDGDRLYAFCDRGGEGEG